MHERESISLARFYAITQIEYRRYFVFQRHFPSHMIFERGCELGSDTLIALESATGRYLRRADRRNHATAPIGYGAGGKQYVTVAARMTLRLRFAGLASTGNSDKTMKPWRTINVGWRMSGELIVSYK